MNTKRIPLAVILMLLSCGALVYVIGSIRPLAPGAKFAGPAPTPATVVAAHAIRLATPPPSALPSPLPPQTAEPPDVALAQAASTPEPTQAPSLDAQAVAETQTSVPAIQTLDAIATRARQTSVPPKKTSSPRLIDHTTNFLLVGTDTRTSDPTWQPNTDVMMVLFLDTANQQAALMSFPRDLVVAIPGHQAFRMNYAYHYGWEKGGPEAGVALLKQILQNDFGIRVDHWALIDFNGLNKIVDTLGGIEVNVPCALQDTIDQQAFTIPAGQVQMDYLTTKRYIQSRYTTSDTSRNFRQQRVVWAMAKKALAMNAPDRVPLLYEQLRESVATDMTLLDMVSLVPGVYQLDLQHHPERLHAHVTEPPDVYPWIAPNGAWLFMPNYDAIQKELDQLFNAPEVAAPTASASECPATAATPPPTDLPTPTPTAGP